MTRRWLFRNLFTLAGVVGGIAAAAVVALIGAYYWRRRRRSNGLETEKVERRAAKEAAKDKRDAFREARKDRRAEAKAQHHANRQAWREWRKTGGFTGPSDLEKIVGVLPGTCTHRKLSYERGGRT